MCVCVCVYYIVHSHAIRPCHPSRYFLLAWVLPRRDLWYLLRKALIRRNSRGILSLQFLLKPSALCASLSVSLLFSRYSRSSPTGPNLSCPLFSPAAQVSPVSHMASMTLLGFPALLPPSSALSNLAPRFQSLDSGAPYDASVSLRCRIFRLW